MELRHGPPFMSLYIYGQNFVSSTPLDLPVRFEPDLDISKYMLHLNVGIPQLGNSASQSLMKIGPRGREGKAVKQEISIKH